MTEGRAYSKYRHPSESWDLVRRGTTGLREIPAFAGMTDQGERSPQRLVDPFRQRTPPPLPDVLRHRTRRSPRAPLFTALSNRLRGLPVATSSHASPARLSRPIARGGIGLRRIVLDHHGHVRHRLGALHQHRQPLDPRRPADRRGLRSAERLEQPVITSATEHGVLRGRAPRRPRCRRPARTRTRCGGNSRARAPARGRAPSTRRPHRARTPPPRRTRPLAGDRNSSITGALATCGRSARSLLSSIRSGLISSRGLRLLAQLAAHRAEMRDQRRAPRLAARGIAQRVEPAGHALDAQLAQQLVGKGDQLDIGLRLGPRRSLPRRAGWNWRKRPFCGRS